MSPELKQVEFSTVPVGGWFKASGARHLKISETHGVYRSYGTRYEPRRFSKSEIVFVE